jgi:hypothetical protein
MIFTANSVQRHLVNFNFKFKINFLTILRTNNFEK